MVRKLIIREPTERAAMNEADSSNDELNRFLSNEFYATIYLDVLSHGYSPLEFFRRLEDLFSWMEINRATSLKYPYPLDELLNESRKPASSEPLASEEYSERITFHAYLLCQLYWLIKSKIEAGSLVVDSYWRQCAGIIEVRASIACWEYLQHARSPLPAPSPRVSFGESKINGRP